jgi:integrase
MASLYKKPITITDPKTGHRVKAKSKKWWGRYCDENGLDRRVPLACDKTAALAMLNEIVRKVEYRLAGLENPIEEHAKRPLAAHLDDFREFLEGKGNTYKHARQTANRVKKLLTGCGFKLLPDISPSAVVDWLKRERAAGQLGIRSSNYYLAATKAFINWMVKDGRSDRNRLAYLDNMNARVDVRRERRCLTKEELSLLLQAARAGKPIRRISGKDREMVYFLALNTGLRCSELTSLTPESFTLVGDSPSVTVDASYSKRRRQDIQPLPQACVPAIAAWLKEKPGRKRIWPALLANFSAKMLRKDLARARAAWVGEANTHEEEQTREASHFLTYRDARGRVFDFHALRHWYISNLALIGLHPKVAQSLARHSTITLTMDFYTHLELFDVAGSVNNLPHTSLGDIAETPALQATGTDGTGRSEVTTVVPRGANNGAILPASASYQLHQVAPKDGITRNNQTPQL